MADRKKPGKTKDEKPRSDDAQGKRPARKSSGDRLIEAGCHPTLFYPTDVYDQSNFGFGGED